MGRGAGGFWKTAVTLPGPKARQRSQGLGLSQTVHPSPVVKLSALATGEEKGREGREGRGRGRWERWRAEREEREERGFRREDMEKVGGGGRSVSEAVGCPVIFSSSMVLNFCRREDGKNTQPKEK